MRLGRSTHLSLGVRASLSRHGTETRAGSLLLVRRMELRESDALHDGWRRFTVNAARTCARCSQRCAIDGGCPARRMRVRNRRVAQRRKPLRSLPRGWTLTDVE
jgi:hypothetical protein